jgi:hypothetical protein
MFYVTATMGIASWTIDQTQAEASHYWTALRS